MNINMLVLMLIIGIVMGGIAAVLLRGGRGIFLINVLFGLIGAALGGLLPVLLGTAIVIDTADPAWMMRAVFGAFALVLFASLFRSARPQRLR